MLNVQSNSSVNCKSILATKSSLNFIEFVDVQCTVCFYIRRIFCVIVGKHASLFYPLLFVYITLKLLIIRLLFIVITMSCVGVGHHQTAP